MRQSEVLLDSMSRDMLQMRDLQIWAADGTNTSEDVQAMATQLISLRDGIFATANTRDRGVNDLSAALNPRPYPLPAVPPALRSRKRPLASPRPSAVPKRWRSSRPASTR